MVSVDPLMSTPRMLGERVKRMEDPRLITGRGSYIDDIKLPGTVHLQLVRSPYAHARILSVNTEKAKAMPGVLAVWTGADVLSAPIVPPAGMPDFKMGRRPMLAVDKARHVGDPVAAVIAETRYQARDAAMAIEVEYEALPAVTNAEQAIADGAPQIHEQAPNNIAGVRPLKFGDVDAAFREADRIVSGRILQPKLVPMFLEPRATLAQWEPSTQKLTIWASTQGAHGTRGTYAAVLGLDELHIRVIAPDIGGSFGAKTGGYPDEIIVPWAAMQLNRPVKYIEDRRDHFVQTGHGRGQITDIEAAVKNDGTILGVRARILADIGAYASGGGNMQPSITLMMGVGSYKFRNIDYEATLVYTNETQSTFYRGAGRPEAAYMMERLADLIAYDLNFDPVDVRRKNLIPKDAFPYQTPTGRTYDSGDYEGALDTALRVADYDGLRKWQAEQQAQGKVVGIGLATFVEVAGGGPTPQGAPRGMMESATIRVDPTGSVVMLTGTSPHGQGTATSLAQILAPLIGVAFEKIQVQYGDTDVVHWGGGTGGSGALIRGGNATFLAASKLREKIHRVAALMLEANPDDITLEEDKYIVRGTPGRGVTLAEIARRAYSPWGFPKDLEPGLEATQYFEPAGQTFPFGTHLAVVEIDRDSGKVDLTRFIAVDDVGTIVSPMLMEGQVHGGVAQGVAAALYEEVVYDDSGQLVTATLMDYAALKADNLPSMDVVHHSTPSPFNPLGAKGVGESGTTGATPAVVNAVLDALKPFGVRHLDMPLTAEKVWRAMNGL